MLESLNITSGNLIIWLSAAAAFLAVVAMILPFLQKDQAANRLKSVAKRREELSQKQMEQLTPRASLRSNKKTAQIDLMKKVLEQLKLQEALSSKKLREQLFQAGYRKQSSVVIYLFSRLITSITFAAGTAFVIFLMINLPYSTTTQLLIVGAASLLGFYFPKLMITNAAQKRRKSMARVFPDTMDLLVICVEAGLSIENAFARVTDEIADQSPTLSQELGLTTAELAYLGDRTKAYTNFAARTGLPAVKSLATALNQSEKYGTPVSVALKVLSQEQRDNRMSAAEKKAAALPAQLTVPMIVFFLPLLFLVVIGPSIIQVMNL